MFDPITFFIGLLIIYNPIAKLFIFNEFCNELETKQRQRRAIESGVTMFILMILAFWFGSAFFHSVIDIHIYALEIAGGILIFHAGFRLLRNIQMMDHCKHDNFAYVPFGFPIGVCPGTLSFIIVHGANQYNLKDQLISNVLMTITVLILFVLLYFSKQIIEKTNLIVVAIFNKIMAVVLMSIAVQMICKGLTSFYGDLIK